MVERTFSPSESHDEPMMTKTVPTVCMLKVVTSARRKIQVIFSGGRRSVIRRESMRGKRRGRRTARGGRKRQADAASLPMARARCLRTM